MSLHIMVDRNGKSKKKTIINYMNTLEEVTSEYNYL